jgi:signal transduction histidine kinase/ligand-binding sensor domain-containing protein
VLPNALAKSSVHLRFASLAWIALVLFLASISKAERLPVKTYTVADGLLRDNVYRIRQDSRGFLWFCTAEGISRFDGYGFTNFTTDDGLQHRQANDFLETSKGTYLVATSAGIARLNPHGSPSSRENPLFTVYLPDNPKAKRFQVLYEDRDGQIWVGSSDGLYKLNESGGEFKLEFVPLGESLAAGLGVYIAEIIKDRRGALWVGTQESGLFRLRADGKVERFTTANGLPNNVVVSLLEDADGRIWAGMREPDSGGLCLLKSEPDANGSIVARLYTKKDGLPANWIPDLLQTGDGRFWVATIAGLCLWQERGEAGGSVCKTYTAKNGICDLDVWSLIEDKNGNLWTGSKCGAKKVARYGFTTFDKTDGLGGESIRTIFENQVDELFAGVPAGVYGQAIYNVSRFEADKFSLGNPRLPKQTVNLGWGWNQTVWQDGGGAWWIPTGEGLFRSPPRTSFENLARTELEKIETGAEGKEIFRLFEDSRGDVWIATIAGASELLRWERASQTWHNYTEQVGFGVFRRVGTAFVEDRSGNLWIATGAEDSALIRYRDGHFTVFTQLDGAPPGWTKDLFIDSAGSLWLTNSIAGAWRLDDTNADRLQFVKYTTAGGLSSNDVLCITEDRFGRIYLGTGRGIDRLDPATGQVENFTTADGLPSSYVEIAYRDRTGALWFATAKELARFMPEPERASKPPIVLITGLRIAGVEQKISFLGETEAPHLDLTSDQKQISVDFIGLGATLGEKLKYEYRFGNSGWTPTTERTVNFANLSSGEYQFEVRAQTADRIYSQTLATVSFKIAAPFWQSPWFIIPLFALTSAAIYFFHRFRLTRLLQMERIRTRIASDLHDDIGANLTRISLLSEVAKQKSDNGNGNLLSSIADIARESVASMNDIVWAVSPDHDSLLDLTRRMRQHAEEVFAYREIDLDFHAPTTDADLKLSVGARRDLLLIFKEAVSNAARHSDCSKVQIDFSVENSIVCLRIADNGKGFDAENSNGDGQGLRSMTRRARALGGDLQIYSQNGTIVKFGLPLQKASRV